MQDYFINKKNPILGCLADQMTTSSPSILETIFSMLKTDGEKWPRNQRMTKEEWMKRMKEAPYFYWFTSRSKEEMMEQEILLLFLCAKALKRQIVVIPFLEDGSQLIFGEEFNHQIFLMGCNTIWDENFFISIFHRIQ